MPLRAIPLFAFVVVVTACDLPSPQAPAEPIGEYPVWGKGFGEEAAQPAGDDSLLAPGQGAGGGEGAAGGDGAEGPAPSEAPNAASSSGGGGSVTPGQPSPFANEDWGGGNAGFGKMVFSSKCARCHGQDGMGGEVADVGTVPTLRDVAWHERITDKELASTIAHGKNKMPGFMQELDGRELRGLIAFVRTLKGAAQ